MHRSSLSRASHLPARNRRSAFAGRKVRRIRPFGAAKSTSGDTEKSNKHDDENRHKKHNGYDDSDGDEVEGDFSELADPFVGDGDVYANIAKNEVFFYSPVNKGTIRQLLRCLEKMQLTESIKAAREGRLPGQITLRINSEGGSLHHGLMAHDSLRSRFPNLKVVGDGLVASAATFIFLAGSRRELQPNCFFMIHQLRQHFDELMTHHDVLETAAINKQLTSAMKRIYNNRTSIPKPKLDHYLRTENYISASRCIRYGIAHSIETPGQLSLDPPRTPSVRAPLSASSSDDERTESDGSEGSSPSPSSEESEGSVGSTASVNDRASTECDDNKDETRVALRSP